MRQVSAFIAIAFAAIFLLSFSAASGEPDYENPDLQLKFNLKGEGDMLSPQTKLPGEAETTKTVTAQYDNFVGFRSNREPVNVSTWTSEPVEFDLSISIKSFSSISIKSSSLTIIEFLILLESSELIVFSIVCNFFKSIFIFLTILLF